MQSLHCELVGESQPGPEQGFTLIEVIVALLVFTVGALALVAGSAFVGREMNSNAIREQSVRIATSRLELVASQCERASSGSEKVGAVVSRWSISPVTNGVAVSETVTYTTAAGRRSDEYHAAFSCP